MLPDLTRRADLVEIMDRAEDLPEEELAGALETLAFVNRGFGGNRIVFSLLERWLAGWPKDRPVRLLDVGTGGGDLLVDLRAWAKKRGRTMELTGLDSDPAVLALAKKRSPGLEFIHGSLLDFSRRGRTFDVVVASLMLHHVPQNGLDGALRALDALSSRFLLVSDLRRCAAGWLGAVAVTAFTGRVSRHDGPVSVRRAFTSEELGEAARRAGLPHLRVERRFPFRLTLSGEKHG